MVASLSCVVAYESLSGSARTQVSSEPLSFLRKEERQLVAARNDEIDPALLGRA